MKKIICGLLALFMMLALGGCGHESVDTDTFLKPQETAQPDKTAVSDQTYIDLTQLSSTMVYSEVYNMMVQPEGYVGKTIKMKGQFSTYQDESTGKMYYACIIADATACCSQGIEFVWKGEHSYPDDYPSPESEITVVGTFDTYKEGEYQYCRLLDAELTF